MPALAAAVPLIQVALIPANKTWDHNHLDVHFGLGADWQKYPRDTLAMLRTLPPGRTLNDLISGGYLIWERVPGGVFADGRLLDLDWLRTVYTRFEGTPASLDAVADQYGAAYGVVMEGRRPLAHMMTSDWTPLFYGDASVLLVRDRVLAQLPDGAALSLDPLRYLEPLSDHRAALDAYYDQLLAQPDGAARLGQAIARARARRPDSPLLRRALDYLSVRHPELVGP